MQTAANDRPGGPVDDRAAVASDPCSDAWEAYAAGPEFARSMDNLTGGLPELMPPVRRALFLAFISGYSAR